MDGLLRVTVIETTEVVKELTRRHKMSPLASIITGRVATAALMLGTTLKGKQIVTVQVRGTGPIGMIRATADAHGTVRAYVATPDLELPLTEAGRHDIKTAVGANEGVFEVIKDLGLKDPYHGIVPLVTGTIYDDMAYYLLASEQTRSAVALGEAFESSDLAAAGGYLVQALPGAGDEVEARIRELPSIGKMIEQGLKPEEILESLIGQAEGLKVVSRQDVTFKCSCSRERFAMGLHLVGFKDTINLLDDGSDAKLTLNCHFCNENYDFSRSQIEAIFTTN